jgi:hypothetical protein
MNNILVFIALSLFTISCTQNKHADLIYTSTPASINAEAHYLFFMHGKIVEKKGLPASSGRYGDYDYFDMLDSFASYGFNVISEARGSGTDVHDYAYKVAKQVEKLISSGVPASHITVSGFSKGGRMTLIVSSMLNLKDINYVVLAGCRLSNRYDYDLNPSGRVLSIYDSSDDTFGSCSRVFAEGKGNLETNEIVLNTGDGHGVFYTPIDEWVAPMMSWAKK